MIKCENVFKSYGNTQVLKGVSLNIADGEFAVLLGASGSGKSTLLGVLSGLERADGGIVSCAGCELSAMIDKQLTLFRRDNVGFIFQQYYLLPHLSAEANVRLGADLAGNADHKLMLTEVGLGDKLKSKPAELSGGEQQRVCIARALAKKPKVLFADEPTGALDEATGRHVLDCMIRLKREAGFTMLMVTHNKNIAEIADTVITMNSGVITGAVRNDSPKSAYDIGW